MAKAVKTRANVEVPELHVQLHAPGMTTLLRAGAGGLASSLRSLLLRNSPESAWPAPVPLGPGQAWVEPSSIRLSWGGRPPEETLEFLFRECFRIREPQGLIDLPGACAPGLPPALEVAAALQDALKLTFLQHGSTTTKAGAAKSLSVTVDEQPLQLVVQGYSRFVHQDAWKEVAKALRQGSVTLAGWAYPGAAERHIGLRVTKMEYTAAEALCACFALVGALSYKVPQGRGGALVALAPSDLVRFAGIRPALTPRRLEETSVSGASDAVLGVQLALRMETRMRQHRELDAAEAFTLRTLPWARQQKSRSGVLHAGALPEEVLDRYETAARALPNRLRVLPLQKKGKGAKEQERTNFFVTTSVLRAFITENLAAGRPWYADFATATVTVDSKPRFIHYFRAKDNLGALFSEERKGLIAMLNHLEDAEQVLVESVHVALRQRFGAIADESRSNPVAMRNRWQAERDRWRLAFAGAKTFEQVRAALADLWSRAGSNRELQSRWRDVLPLLRQEHWRAVRDLALIALASYQGQGVEVPQEQEESLPSEFE